MRSFPRGMLIFAHLKDVDALRFAAQYSICLGKHDMHK